MQNNNLAYFIADINGKGSQEKWIFEKAKEIKSLTPGFWCLAMAEYISGLVLNRNKNIVDIQFYIYLVSYLIIAE